MCTGIKCKSPLALQWESGCNKFLRHQKLLSSNQRCVLPVGTISNLYPMKLGRTTEPTFLLTAIISRFLKGTRAR